jgi:hypothetical protein
VSVQRVSEQRVSAEPRAPLSQLDASGRLAWQATAAVGLLERFGDLVTVALEAVGSGDDEALDAALGERERLLRQLEPLLGDLAAARSTMTDGLVDGSNAQRAVATILRPVDDALRYANLLHVRLAAAVADRRVPSASAAPSGRRAPLALVR